LERDLDRSALLDSSALLDALDHWLRRQSISMVLPKSQAKQLLRDLREDQRFWAQQRRQFARAWVLFEAGLRAETRPVGTLLGNETSAKILSVAEQMETDTDLVNAVVRSEIVEVGTRAARFVFGLRGSRPGSLGSPPAPLLRPALAPCNARDPSSPSFFPAVPAPKASFSPAPSLPGRVSPTHLTHATRPC
jgi:hypothetical protein